MKRTFCVFFVYVCLFLFLPASSFADRHMPEGRVLKFGYLPGYGFSLRNLDVASSRGFIHQLLSRMENYTHYNFEFTPYQTPNALLRALEQGDIDVAVPLTKTPEREEKFLFGRDVMGTGHLMLVSKGKDYGYYRDPAEIHGKTVASYEESIKEITLNAYCEQHGLDVTYVRGNMLDYHTLDADYYLISSLTDAFQNYDSVFSLGRHNYHLVFRHDSLALERHLHLVLQKTVLADDALLPELFLQYYGKNIARRDLTQEEMSLLEGKTFSVGYLEGHEPAQYTDKEGNAAGMMVDIMNLLAQRYGFRVNYVGYSLDDPPEYHESFDLLLSIVGTYAHEREFYKDTEAYLTRSFMLMTSKENAYVEDFSHQNINIGMLQYLSVDLFDVLNEYPRANLSVYTSLDALLRDYDNDYIDAMLLSDAGLNYLSKRYGDDLITLGNSLNLPFKLFVSRKLHPSYVTVFNVIFDYITPDEFEEILAAQSLRYAPIFSVQEFVHQYAYEIGMLVCFFLAMLCFMVYFLDNRKKLAVLNVLRYDKLTGFMTHSYFEQVVSQKMETAQCGEYALIAVDVDSFSAITTHYTYERTHEILHMMSQLLNTHLKGEDGIITRTSDDNFLLLRKHIPALEALCAVNTHIVPQMVAALGEGYPLSLSLGIYPVEDCKEQVVIMVDRANVARNKGKNECRTTAYVFDDNMKDEYGTRLQITYSMENALKNEEFFLVFQPKIDFKTLRVKGAEALVRWQATTGERIYPNAFIPVFEENGFIYKLDMYVFKKVCEFLQKHQQYTKNQIISVNISSRTMLESSLVGTLKMIVDKYRIDPRTIELEITESAMCEAFAETKINDFQAIGFSVSIDDFGAGVSSLNRLGSMHANVLKLDKAFLDVCDDNVRGKVVVQDTIAMAKRLDMLVVAEGVETNTQAHWLRELDCDVAQGYYFSQPLSQEDFLNCLVTNKLYSLPKEN